MAIEAAKKHMTALYTGDWETYKAVTKAEDAEILRLSYEAMRMHLEFQTLIRKTFGNLAIGQWNEALRKIYLSKGIGFMVNTQYYPEKVDELFKNAKVDIYKGLYIVRSLRCAGIMVQIEDGKAYAKVGSGAGARVDKEHFMLPGIKMWEKGLELLKANQCSSVEDLARKVVEAGTQH